MPPFGDGSSPNSLSNLLANVLEDCRFAPFAGSFAEGSTYYLEPPEVDRPIDPKFSFAVNSIDEVLSCLPLSAAQMELVVSARSRRLKRYFRLGQWSLAEVPSSQWSPPSRKSASIPPGGGVDFIVAIRVVADDRALAAQGLGLGKVLCRREFAVKLHVNASTFPFSWREFGADSEYPSELLWTVRWKDVDHEDPYSRPIDEVLTVYMNKAAEQRILAMNAAAGKGDLTWKMLAAEILTLIWSEVLKGTETDPDPTDQESLAGQVYTRLAKSSGRAYGELPGMVRERGLLELRANIAKILGVVQ